MAGNVPRLQSLRRGQVGLLGASRPRLGEHQLAAYRRVEAEQPWGRGGGTAHGRAAYCAA